MGFNSGFKGLTGTVSSPSLSIPFLRHMPIGTKFTYDMIYLLTAVGLTPDGSSTVHIYTQTIHRTTRFTN